MLPRILLIASTAGMLACTLGGTAVAAVTPPAGFIVQRELSNLTRPTRIAWAPDGRRFVAEKDGLVKVAAPGSASATTILDIRAEVMARNDRGLLGFALDSAFPDNGYVYLLFTFDPKHATPAERDQPGPAVSQLRRYTLDANSQVVPGSMRVLLGSYVSGACPAPNNAVDCIPADSTTHTIGTVLSAPDGTLFVSNGDAASFSTTDPLSLRTYDERSLAGKIMHVDREGRGLPGHPFCPAETNLDRVCTKLYAKGFRNPYRFTQLSSGALLVGDVGWNSYEELNLLTAGGGSYGWPCYEGPARTPTWKDQSACSAEYAKEGTANAHLPPAYAYQHVGTTPAGWAVLAGPEYTGTRYPEAYRGIFFADYGARFMKRLSLGSGGQAPVAANFAGNWTAVDLTTGANGDLAWVDLGNFAPNGGFAERLIYSPTNAPPTAVAGAEPSSGSAPLTVNFDALGSSDPNGDVLSYSWNFGDGSATASGATVTHTYTEAGSFTATLTVSDGRGGSDTDTLQIDASNSPPVPSIELPAPGARYRDGSPLTVRGSASDAEQGQLPASAFDWNVRIIHREHEHLLTSPSGLKEFEMTPVRDHDADSHYIVGLTVTDAHGATASASREIHPEVVPLTLLSVPPGAPLSYAGTEVTAPWETEAAIGFLGTVSAAESFTSGGVTRSFVGWSSGAPRVHDLDISSDPMTITATYNAAPSANAVASLSTVAAGTPVSLDGSGSTDPDGDTLAYSWDFGDGTAGSSGRQATHAYAAPGRYEAALTVTDPYGAVSTDRVVVQVTGGEVDADLLGPRISVGSLRASPPRRLAGTVADPAGVKAARLAVARLRKGGCQWVVGARPRLSKRRPCSPRVWSSAALKGRRWTFALPSRLPAGRYRVWFLATDKLGNRSRVTVDGRGQLRFAVGSGTRASACERPLLARPLRCGRLAG